MIHLIQIVDLVGVYGLMFLIVWVNVFFADCICKIRGDVVRYFVPKAVVTVFVFILTVSYGYWRISNISLDIEKSERINVALIQGNISQDDKWLPDKAQGILDKHRRQVVSLKNSPVDLIVWPESALPIFIETTDKSVDPELLGIYEGNIDTPPLTFLGAISETPKLKYYNSAILFDSRGRILERYHKSHLTPFGEYIPYDWLLFFANKLTKPSGDFLFGESHRPLDAGRFKFGALICYEDTFPEISRESVLMGAGLLVNVTNNAWFGETSAPLQQLALSVFRAVENRRYFVRATNTGVSAVVAPTGQVLVESRLFEPALIVANVGLLSMITPYTSLGDWFAWGCVAYSALGIIIVIILYVKGRKKHEA